MERRSASEGERASAEWVARRLEEAGARDVRVEHFRFARTYAYAFLAHVLAAALGAARGGLAGRTLAAAALASFEAEYSGRTRWVHRLLPKGEGANVVARVAAAGERRRTVVLVAHHDAANTGLVWHPLAMRPGDALAARTGARGSLAILGELALGLAAAGSRRLALGMLAANAAALLDVARSPTVPGANDNASGVAGLLALAERLTADPVEGTEVVLLVPGCEESGMGGMEHWLRTARPDPASTLAVGLDTIGSGEPIVLTAEGGVWPVRYREEDVAVAERAAPYPPRRWRIGGWTDPVLARLAGIPAISILSVRDGGFPNYHRLTDTPERVDWRCVEMCVALAEAVVRSAPEAR